MLMRRLMFTAASALALVGAGIAVAHDGQSKSVRQVSATFTATTAGNVRTETCTGSDGSYATTHGEWTGTSTSSEPTLNGNATIDADTVVNTTTGYGTVSGRIRIDTSDGHHTSASFDAVDANGHIAGLADGKNEDLGSELLGNLSADWSATGGFTNGKLGGTTGGDAVLVGQGGCQPQPAPKPETIDVHGAITAVSSTSISAAGVTCVVPSTLSSAVGSLQVGTRVELTCVAANGTNTLQRVEASHEGKHH
jgi:hypothetical protein